jgi:hypothetical protein
MTNLEKENDGNNSEINKPTQRDGKGRREFIKSAAAVVGGITVVASLTGEANAQTGTAQVYVSTTGTTGNPMARVAVDSNISAASLGPLLQNVVTNSSVLAAAGLASCLPCKSGLDIMLITHFQGVFSLPG